MMQPERVLPSNASPLDSDALRSSSRILQEHSGNRQPSEFPYGVEYDPKYVGSFFGENSHVPQQQHSSQPHHLRRQLHHPRPQHHQPWKYAIQRGGHDDYDGYASLAHPKTQVAAEYLYHRFKQSEAYVKYRARQTKDDKRGSDEQKWPEHLEKAFFTALVKWPPMGRRQKWWKEKRRGRNELIADCIEELTGEERDRKQVSSHIQVLKPFVENDPHIMRYFSKEDLSQDSRHAGNAAYGVGRRTSSYPVTSLPSSVRAAIPSRAALNSSYSVSKLKQDPEIIEPVEFQMFIQQKHAAAEGAEEIPPRRLHTYTRSVSNPMEPELHLHDWQTISRDFPLLARMNNQDKLDCNVIVAEASLGFPGDHFKAPDGTTIPGVELGISFLCTSRRFSPSSKEAQVKCHNTFYEGGVIVGEPQRSEVRFGPSDRVSDNGVFDTQIKFGSTFWAKTLGQMASRLLNPSKDWCEEVSAQIRNITVLQELFLVANGQYERLLVIHWTFRHSTRAEGSASWRRLKLPCAVSQYSRVEAHAPVARQDSFLEFDSQYLDVTANRPQAQLPLPVLQSPFAYDSSSSSALSSATWPTSASETDIFAPPSAPLDFSVDNTFDFNAGNISITYDNNINFDNFDSSAFDFNTTADFAADPALESYSHSWTDPSVIASFDAQPHGEVEDPTFMAQPHDFDAAQAALYNGTFETQYTQQEHQAMSEQHPYVSARLDQQAFGGAGEDFERTSKKEEDLLAASANASFIASALGEKKGSEF